MLQTFIRRYSNHNLVSSLTADTIGNLCKSLFGLDSLIQNRTTHAASPCFAPVIHLKLHF